MVLSPSVMTGDSYWGEGGAGSHHGMAPPMCLMHGPANPGGNGGSVVEVKCRIPCKVLHRI